MQSAYVERRSGPHDSGTGRRGAGRPAARPIHRSALRGSSSDWRSALLTEYFLEKVSPQVPSWQAVRSDRWKYIRYSESAEWDELYDLAADPREERNLVRDPASREPLAEMRQELDRLLGEMK